MDAREILLNAIDCALAAQIISQEDLRPFCGEDGNTYRGYLTAKQTKKIVDYLNGVSCVSNQNLANIARGFGAKFKIKKTLEKCLMKGRFKYKQQRGTRWYYVKSGFCSEVVEEDIVT